MKLKGFIYICLISFLLIAQDAVGSLIVIKDSGNTTPIGIYLSSLHTKRKNTHKVKEHIQVNQILYPTKSELTPGKVKTHHLAFKKMPISIFVVGDDKLSVEWLKKNSGYIKRIHATGLITNVKSQQRVTKIEKATGVILIPASMVGMSSLTGTNHYPFLIAKGWVVQ